MEDMPRYPHRATDLRLIGTFRLFEVGCEDTPFVLILYYKMGGFLR
jgi:hypothetical protein